MLFLIADRPEDFLITLFDIFFTLPLLSSVVLFHCFLVLIDISTSIRANELQQFLLSLITHPAGQVLNNQMQLDQFRWHVIEDLQRLAVRQTVSIPNLMLNATVAVISMVGSSCIVATILGLH